MDYTRRYRRRGGEGIGILPVYWRWRVNVGAFTVRVRKMGGWGTPTSDFPTSLTFIITSHHIFNSGITTLHPVHFSFYSSSFVPSHLPSHSIGKFYPRAHHVYVLSLPHSQLTVISSTFPHPYLSESRVSKIQYLLRIHNQYINQPIHTHFHFHFQLTPPNHSKLHAHDSTYS